MKATIELTPDQLAQIVAAVFDTNGYKANGLALYLDGQLVGYDRVVVHYEMANGIEVYPPPKHVTREQLNQMIYPDGNPHTFSTRERIAVG